MTDPFARPPDPPPQESEATVSFASGSPSPWPGTEETLIDPVAQSQGWQWDQSRRDESASPGYHSPTSGGYSADPTYFAQSTSYSYSSYPSAAPSPWTPNLPYPYFEAALPEHPSATPALILGILSIVGVIPLGPLAWYLGAKGQREMRENPGRWRPSGSLTAGVILGVISTIPLVLGVLSLFVLFAFIVSG